MVRITEASEQFRQALNICRQVFTAAGREFIEPKGVVDLIQKARRLYTEGGDETAAITEVQNATHWLNGIAMKFLRGAIEFFDGRINELSYMSLDRDILDNMRARLREFCAAVMQEDGHSFDLRIAAYAKLAQVVGGAQVEQQRRIEHREEVAREREQDAERAKRQRRRQEEEQQRLLAIQQQEAAETAARAEREQQFDQLFQI